MWVRCSFYGSSFRATRRQQMGVVVQRPCSKALCCPACGWALRCGPGGAPAALRRGGCRRVGACQPAWRPWVALRYGFPRFARVVRLRGPPNHGRGVRYPRRALVLQQVCSQSCALVARHLHGAHTLFPRLRHSGWVLFRFLGLRCGASLLLRHTLFPQVPTVRWAGCPAVAWGPPPGHVRHVLHADRGVPQDGLCRMMRASLRYCGRCGVLYCGRSWMVG